MVRFEHPTKREQELQDEIRRLAVLLKKQEKVIAKYKAKYGELDEEELQTSNT